MQQNLTEPQTKVLTGNLPYLKSVVGYTAENYYIIQDYIKVVRPCMEKQFVAVVWPIDNLWFSLRLHCN